MLGDILTELIGSAVVERLSGKESPRPREGEVNASMGAVAAFLGFLALMAGVSALQFGVMSLANNSAIPVALLTAAIAGLLGFGAFRAGAKALRVTRRRVGLARFGKGVGALVMCVAAFSVALALIGTFRWLL